MSATWCGTTWCSVLSKPTRGTTNRWAPRGSSRSSFLRVRIRRWSRPGMLSERPSQNRRTPEGVRMFSEPLLLFRNAPRGLDRAELLQFARLLQGRVAGGGAFTCLVTDDRDVRRLNLQFLGRDYATDVLSFPSAKVKGMSEAGIGEMVISAETAAKQAREYGHSVE